MAGAQFDSKSFNPQAFGSYIETIPQVNKNELIKSRVITQNARIKQLLSSQTGSFYGVIPFYGRIGGDAVNYDGKTDISATGLETYEQAIIAVGRAKAWTEKDFSTDITAGVDFMSEVAKQVAWYWDEVNTGILLSILKGVFSITGDDKTSFVDTHTLDISGEGTNNKIDPTTLNIAMQKACGDKRAKFSLVFMHSAVATNLENQNLLEYLKYTDSKGVQRSLPLATWNGRTVIIDDSFTIDTSGVGVLSEGTSKTRGAIPTAAGAKYVTYIFGEGAIQYADLGVKEPYEMSRDPKTNGGEDTLYTRERLCYAPYGLSFTKSSVASHSPTNTELENGANWKLIDNGKTSTDRKTIDPREIAIARIISLG